MNSAYQKNSKSFYIILSLSVVAVAAAAVGISFTTRKVKSIRQNTTESSQITVENEITEQANNVTDGVEDDRTTEKEEPDETTTKKAEEKTTAVAATTEKSVECVLPVGTDIVKDYSNGLLTESKTMNDWRLHNGVDFAGEANEEVKAVCAGTVTKCYKDSLWGNTVEIEHENGMTAKYCGLEETAVKEGESVEKEQTIGTLGIVPVESADSIHLHLEILKNGKTVDPIEALGRENGTE